jgi:hypothetical protein
MSPRVYVSSSKIVGPQQGNLGKNWVGAGSLEIGDKIRTADGSSGTVLSVLNVVQARVMYNLEVQDNHDFFVGENGWLVHNCERVAFGMQSAGLKKFAEELDAKTFADLGLNSRSPTFMRDLEGAMNGAKEIKFNLNGMQDVGELLRNKKYGVSPASTNWELQTIGFNRELRAKTTFHLGEKTFTYEQLLEHFPWKAKP